MCGFSPPVAAVAVPNQAEARGLQHHTDLPRGWQVAKPSDYLLPLRCVSRESDGKWSSWDSNRHP